MKLFSTILIVLGLFFVLGSIGSCVTAKGAIHETVGLVSFLIAVALIGLGVVLNCLDRLARLLRDIRDRLPPAAPPPDPGPDRAIRP